MIGRPWSHVFLHVETPEHGRARLLPRCTFMELRPAQRSNDADVRAVYGTLSDVFHQTSRRSPEVGSLSASYGSAQRSLPCDPSVRPLHYSLGECYTTHVMLWSPRVSGAMRRHVDRCVGAGIGQRRDHDIQRAMPRDTSDTHTWPLHLPRSDGAGSDSSPWRGGRIGLLVGSPWSLKSVSSFSHPATPAVTGTPQGCSTRTWCLRRRMAYASTGGIARCRVHAASS